jgi:hypothetical protein
MKLYSVAAGYTNKQGVTTIAAVATKANSEAEALGVSLTYIRNEKPTSEGYYNHQVAVYEIPKEWYTYNGDI